MSNTVREWEKEYVGYVKSRFEKFPIETYPKINTMDKKLIIECATSGPSVKYWGPKEIYPVLPPGFEEGGVRFPAVPCTMDEQVGTIVDSVLEGAAANHHHAIDPEKGYRTARSYDPKMIAEIYDKVFEQADMVTLQDTFDRFGMHADWITKTKKLLTLGKGNRYCQGSVVLVGFGKYEPEDFHISDKSLLEGVPFLEDNNVKPIYQIYDTYSAIRLVELLIEPGIATMKPHVLNLHLGKHNAHAIHRDPWAALQLITNMNMVKESIPDSVIGVYTGGRNWLPVTVLGIMLGADIIRVGIEDCYWTYPHKDEIIKSNAYVVRKIATIAKELGREIATPQEARQILGITLTSEA